jgi:arylformamidase
MTIYDISLPLSETLVVWPGDPPLRLTQPSHLDRGDLYTVTRIEMGVHSGTHLDAPAHFLPGGQTVDALDLDLLVGPAQVVHVPDSDALSAAVLEGLEIPPGTERVLFRTRNSARWAAGETEFWPGFVGITEDGARWLVARGIQLVGIDYLSVAPFDDAVTPHQVLLGAGVIAVEGLALDGIDPGTYWFACLPLKIAGAEGAPARAILMDRAP